MFIRLYWLLHRQTGILFLPRLTSLPFTRKIKYLKLPTVKLDHHQFSLHVPVYNLVVSRQLHKIKWNLPVNHLIENINKEGYLVIEKWYNFPIFQKQTLYFLAENIPSKQLLSGLHLYWDNTTVSWASITSSLLSASLPSPGLDSSFTPAFYRLVIIGHNVICFTLNC